MIYIGTHEHIQHMWFYITDNMKGQFRLLMEMFTLIDIASLKALSILCSSLHMILQFSTDVVASVVLVFKNR